MNTTSKVTFLIITIFGLTITFFVKDYSLYSIHYHQAVFMENMSFSPAITIMRCLIIITIAKEFVLSCSPTVMI